MEQVLLAVGQAKSPVSGESFDPLSPGYKAFKKAQGGTPKPNMELTGDMMDSLTFKTTSEGVEIGFFNSQAAKADGHLKFSGEENNLPKRRFLPAEGQSFKPEIQAEVRRIIGEALVDNIADEDLKGISTTPQLYAMLRKHVQGTRAQIMEYVLANNRVFNLLDDAHLTGLL